MKTFRTKVTLIFDPWIVSDDSQLTVVMPIPTSDGVINIKNSHLDRKGFVKTDGYGNKMQVCSIQKGETITLTLDVEETKFVKGVSKYVLPAPSSEDMKSTVLIPVTPELEAKATELISSAPHCNPAEVFFHYVRDHMTYEYPMSDMGAQTTLKTLKGDCGDFSILFCGLCRAVDIPARPVYGWMIAPWFVGPHAWAEVYIDDEWLPVDISMAQRSLEFGPMLEVSSDHNFYFGNLDPYRLVLSRGTGLGKGWLEDVFVTPRRLNDVVVTPGMKIDGVSFDFYGELRNGSIPYLQLPYTLITKPKSGSDEEKLFVVSVKPDLETEEKRGLGFIIRQADVMARKPDIGVTIFVLWSLCQGVFRHLNISTSISDFAFFLIAVAYLPWAALFVLGWIRKLRFIKLDLKNWQPRWNELSTVGIDTAVFIAVVRFAWTMGGYMRLPI